MGQVVCRNVAADMMNRDQRFVCRHGQTFGVVDTHQQGADEARCVGHRNGIHILQLHRSIGQCLFHHVTDILSVTAGSDLRNDTAVLLMLRNLRVDHRT